MNRTAPLHPHPALEHPTEIQSLAFNIVGVSIGIGALAIAALQLRRMYISRQRSKEAERAYEVERRRQELIAVGIEMV